MKSVVFIDRDGTIIREPRDKQIDSLEKLEFVPGIISGLRTLAASGATLVMVSNQDGLGTVRFPRKKFEVVQQKLLGILAGEGIRFEKIFICPHFREADCACRKPKLGLVRNWLQQNPIDKQSSFVLGDRVTDVEFAANLGIRAVRIGKELDPKKVPNPVLLTQTPSGLTACESIVRAARTAEVRRETRETQITCRVALSGEGHAHINTGIPFFDHMLEQIARHSGIDMEISAKGDLHIDEHHTVEDVAIVLGEAIRRALGNKKGIGRYGFTLPMDESKASVALDLSGRFAFVYDVEFRREAIGNLSTEMIEHFFRSLAHSLGASLHMECRGRNEHHKAEALFKALAKALAPAVAIDLRRQRIPSSKGTL